MVNKHLYLSGRYEIISRIGTGGMADVYKAMDTKLNRYVAIKVLKREFSEDSKFVSKFNVEAQSSASLSHPNIVNVYDVAEENGVNYIVMELIEGITLKTYIEKRGVLSVREATSIAIQVANGISAAHKNHIVHRDIKPQNIIISRDGKVKVTDFGIARAATSNTISSNAMGSVHYTSPEQARGGYSDFKSDIYSLGVTLYEMVTGHVPFDGDSTVTIAIKHLQEEITPPSFYDSELPIALEDIILKCVQKSPDRRYENMELLIEDLKMSLIDPDGDFVNNPNGIGDETRIITDEDKQKLENILSENEEKNTPEEPEPEEEINPKVKKITKILLIVAAILAGLLIVFLVGKAVGVFKFGPGIDFSSEKIKVPNVVGMTFDEAKKKLNEQGLGIKEKSREPSSTYDVDTIISQDPSAFDSVDKNTTIEVIISSGKEKNTIKVPNVVGKDEGDAQKELEDAGFKVEKKYSDSDTVESGKVISQNPNADTAKEKGDLVTIEISRGTDKIDVPSLVGLTEPEARNAIAKAKLNTGNTTQEYSKTVPAGSIISQNPAAGTRVGKGTAVSFVISKGDVPVSQQKWAAEMDIPLDGYNNEPVTVVLEQNGQTKTLLNSTVVSNPYHLSVEGIPGVSSGKLTISQKGNVISKTDVTFTRVD